MKEFFEKAAMQDHPLRVLQTFLTQEKANEEAKKYQDMRFVGYILEIGYDTVTIITSDPFKVAVGGVPRNSLLIMVPTSHDSLPPHFTLLRVLESAPTPLSKEVQQTYFELQKKSMPELDIFTQSELQWGALKTAVLGMFYPHPEKANEIEFSGDMNNFVSAHKYFVYSPDDSLLDLIVNSLVDSENRFQIGKLRLTECRLPLPTQPLANVDVLVSTKDFIGARTALFGKTRLGKSNVVKIIAQSIIETTGKSKNVGQLIFDINGEYANDNPQDNNLSLKSVYDDRCVVYALTPKESTPSSPLKLNFYEQPDSCISIFRTLLEQANQNAQYVRSFTSVQLPNIDDVKQMPPGSSRTRAVRKIQIYWAILHKAGYQVDEQRLRGLGLTGGSQHAPSHFNPHFKKDLIQTVYGAEQYTPPENLANLQAHLERIETFRQRNPRNPAFQGTNGPLFDANDTELLFFLTPAIGGGPRILRPFMIYHDPQAGHFVHEILNSLDGGQTVILDLGNAADEIRRYFSDLLSKAVFSHQEVKFTNNNLKNHFIQLYFEEAHNLFPRTEDVTTIYSRFAKEGAKYHVGMIYLTQSPTTISKDLLAQTENFFIAHVSSQDEVNSLARLNTAYESIKDDILRAKTVGYIRMLTRSNRFVVPVQVNKFVPRAPEVNKET